MYRFDIPMVSLNTPGARLVFTILISLSWSQADRETIYIKCANIPFFISNHFIHKCKVSGGSDCCWMCLCISDVAYHALCEGYLKGKFQ